MCVRRVNFVNLWMLYTFTSWFTEATVEGIPAEYITFILFIHRALHTYLPSIRSLAQPGQQAYECARSYFIGNRGHDLNGSMSENKGEQLHHWRDIVFSWNMFFVKSLKFE